jgi:chemotaxis protein MotB
MGAQSNAPVIIKRKKIISGGGHHGGAWKVAYADFVTAMMAFFMLMWLLNATTEKQRKGIADYFNPTIPINRISGGGEGSFGGTNIFSEQTLAKNGTGATQRRPAENDRARGDVGTDTAGGQAEAREAQDRSLSEVEKALTARAGESMVSQDVARHIVTKLTDEGLVVELFDLPGAPLFREDTDQPTPALQELTAMIADVFGVVRNDVAVNGHMRAQPVVLRENPVWDLSNDRADRVRLLLQEGHLPPKRIQRVSGFADRKPVAENPMAVRNNRIELILLRTGN